MNCKGIFGRLFGHNYQPVFEYIAPETCNVGQGTAASIERIVRALGDTKHVHTICKRCGDVIEARLP